MKKSLILSMLSIALLSGCGQNVEEIKKEFLPTGKPTDTVDFTGYVMVVNDEAFKELRKIAQENDIPSHINVTGKDPLPPLPDVKFKNAEFANVVSARKAIEDRTAALVAMTEQEVVKHKNGIKDQISEVRGKLAEINQALAPFNTLIAAEQTAYDNANKAVFEIEDRMAKYDEAFFEKFKQVVVAEKLPIDTSSSIRPSRYYRVMNQKACAKADQSKIKYFADQKDGCVISKLDPEEVALEPLFRDYGLDMTLLQIELQNAKAADMETFSALLKAKVVAKNQTGINEVGLKDQIAAHERKIATLNDRLDDQINTEALFYSLRSSDEAFEQALKSYATAAKAYELSLRMEAIKQAGLKFEEFTDENAETSDEHGDDCLIVYVFKDESGKQTVYTAKGNTAGNTKTFLMAFKNKAKERDVKFPIENADDALRAAVSYF